MNLLETGAVASALDTAMILAKRLPGKLSESSRRLYTALSGAAVETSWRRGYSPTTTHVTMHCPLEQVARAVGLSRFAVYRALPALRDLGLIDYRTHKGVCRGETRNTGTLWQVRLTPDRGSAARLSYDDLKHQWRDLDADLRRGRLSYAVLRESAHTSENLLEIDMEAITCWTLPPEPNQNPVVSVCAAKARVDLESILDVRHTPRDERNQMVDLAAQALSEALSDTKGRGFYQKLLWQLLRASDRHQGDHFYSVYLVAVRARVDAREGFARRPGALFVSRLKDAPWWDEVMRGPPLRVGTVPLQS